MRSHHRQRGEMRGIGENPNKHFCTGRREPESGKKSELVQVYTACQFVIAIISTYKKLWRLHFSMLSAEFCDYE